MLYIKIQHIYITILQINVYMLTIWLSYIASAVYKIDEFGSCCVPLFWLPDDGHLQIETYRNIQCDNIM